MSELTEKQAEALEILEKFGWLTSKSFAWKMWPLSPKWMSKDGGKGMSYAAGMFLQRLYASGLVDRATDRKTNRLEWTTSAKGREALVEYRSAKPGTPDIPLAMESK